MFTVTFVLHEKTGMDRADALTYWRDEFAAAIADVPHFADPDRLPTAFVEDVVIGG